MNRKSSGIAWYAREEYERIRTSMEDGHLLPETFDQWLACAERVVERIELAGRNVEKVVLAPGEFERWCRLHGFARNAEARLLFVHCVVQGGPSSLWSGDLQRLVMDAVLPTG